MSNKRDGAAWGFLLVAIVCLTLALFPQWDERIDAATGDRVQEQRLGLWFSPLYRAVRRTSPVGGFTWRAGMQWLSWSMPLMVVGVCSFEAFRQRRCHPTARDQKDGIKP